MTKHVPILLEVNQILKLTLLNTAYYVCSCVILLFSGPQREILLEGTKIYRALLPRPGPEG